ncbi:MAG: permease [Verrucomicrobia bacterium]|nr:MAG: permease [Verrucomicrobiota bacterium]
MEVRPMARRRLPPAFAMKRPRSAANGSPEVIGLGCVAVDELLFVPRYPGRDARQPLRRHQRQCGGLTATALVAAARLGVRAAYAGRLGEGDDSAFVLKTFEREGVDTSRVVRRRGVRVVHAFVVVEEETQTRTILYDLGEGSGADPRLPERGWIQSAKVLLVDRWGLRGMVRAARAAREAGVAVVGDLENGDDPLFDELVALADHLVVPEAFVRRRVGTDDPAEGARRLWREDRAVVIVTCGREGCWVYDGAGAPWHQPAFSVKVVDTTGCGDVFHGAYAAALARGLPLRERVREAAAAAALKATRLGGQAGIPTRRELARFLRERPAA